MAGGIPSATGGHAINRDSYAIRTPILYAVVMCAFLFGQSSPLRAAGSDAGDSGQQVQRVVSVAGALTEIIYVLGEQDRLVGVDTTSTYPREALGLPRVGYMRNLSAEGVLSLTPDLVLATSDAGPPVVLQQIRDAGVPVVQLASGHSLKAVTDHIRAVAGLLGVPEQGTRLASEFESGAAELREMISELRGRPKVAFLLNVGNGSPMVSGRNTAADAMIHLAGAVNVFTDYEGYKPVSAEAMIARAPEILLVTTSTLKLSGGARGLLELPGIGLTPAGRQRRIVAMNGLYLLGFGPRTVQAVTELAGRLRSPTDVGTEARND